MTLFERVIMREIPAEIVYETSEILAFRDINPVAPVHILVIPKKPIPGVQMASETDERLLGQLLLAARTIAVEQGLDRSGYRLVINQGDDGGQTVDHLHCHLIGGRSLSWPPG